MKKYLSLLLFCYAGMASAQTIIINNWQFRQAGKGTWLSASVPGSVHTDLLRHKKIAHPFFASNEAKSYWIDSSDWEYKTHFHISPQQLKQKNVTLIFEGLDTYADVYLNNKKIMSANNMFRRWIVNIKPYWKAGRNELSIYFHSPIAVTRSMAKAALPIVLPDDARVYARKAQYQFGWDWGPQLAGMGIWKKAWLQVGEPKNTNQNQVVLSPKNNGVKLVQQADSIGTSFYFTQNGKPIYAKGVNWIPTQVFPANASAMDYRYLLSMAKDAGMNMIRVWGGGYYEDDEFYRLCDSLGLMVWQDFMFACRMYPGDPDFFASVKAEVKDNIERLSKYQCIVLWCGNNEIDEAWHHWGWQKQFNLHGADSAKVWNDYVRLFRDSLKIWSQQYDPAQRPYISTSPLYGWGNPRSYKNADSHYWGLWWGLEGWEKFKTHTGRFVSEWGMQAMPHYSTVQKYVPAGERFLYSPSVAAHQKASEGFKKLNHYIHKYFFDTSRLNSLSLEQYTYLSQCMQYYIIKNSIATQMQQQPANMGTLIWQLNDCWPVTSWSLIDFYGHPKGGYYAAKKCFTATGSFSDDGYPKNLKLERPHFTITYHHNGISIHSDKAAKYVQLYTGDSKGYFTDNFFDIAPGQTLRIEYKGKDWHQAKKSLKLISLYDIPQL